MMKKQIIATIFSSVFLLSANNALSYLKYDNNGMTQGGGTEEPLNQVKAANCIPSSAKLTMSFNDVSALIEQGGSMWQNRSQSVAAYEIPKGSGLKVIYAGALWMGGKDASGQLKLAALRFREAEDFWAGPLSVTLGSGNFDPSVPVGDGVVHDYGAATIDADQCQAYDKFYTIAKADVIQFSIWWDCDKGILPAESCVSVVKPNSQIMDRINNWPAHGLASKSQDYYLAPFYDNPDQLGNTNLSYNPSEDGDYPWFDDILGRDDIECGVDRRVSLFGDETNWWVFNDVGNIHGETNGDPIGMEIRAQAFSFATNDEVNRMTFYNYELINRGTQTLYNTYFSQFIDADVGGANDDYAGCDVSRGLGYMYNGDNVDEGSAGSLGYGASPPAVGCDFFEGPYQDGDGRDNVGPYIDSLSGLLVTPTVANAINDTGIVYQGIGLGYSDGLIDNERFGMRRFTYFTNGAVFPYTDPQNATNYYNFMSGSWADGSEMYYGGTGAVGTLAADYLFPGDSDPLNWSTGGIAPPFADWSEVNTDGASSANAAGDRRFVQSAGPFTLKPGAVNNITVGIVYGRSAVGTAIASVQSMKNADTKAQALFDACFRILEPPYAPKLEIQELENQLVLVLSNPISSNNHKESYYEEDKINIVDPSVDRFYDFEGYQIYQLVDEDASIGDVKDDTKAQLVAQCDIENDIEGNLVNFVFDTELGFEIAEVMVDAANKGVQHSFLIEEDKFAQGEKGLVNFKRYYYVAIAYAHNNFKTFNPTDPLALDGQKVPYISSRLGHDGSGIKAVEGIPHNPIAESDGLTQNSVYGSGPQITRVDGHGNGGNILDLTSASKNQIIANGYMENPKYIGGKGPINVKVVDPLNVADGYFECLFKNYNPTITNGADTASWVINRYASQGGALLESVSSDVVIDQSNEQIIPNWGVSVQIDQKNYFIPDGATSNDPNYSTDLLDASISFSDETKQWLSGIPDNDVIFPTNWVRSGTYDPNETDPCVPNAAIPDYLENCFYKDEGEVDDAKIWSKILGGVVAPHRLVGYQAGYMPIKYLNDNGTSARNNSAIRFLPSVDIVITSDKSKWTRCPVIELGREPSFNVGNGQAGKMRKSPSVDKNGNPDASGTTGMGWFPGYAIDVESGARLYMAFGENSFLVNDNGSDMRWNPSTRVADGSGNPVLGGMHPIYIYSFQKSTINSFPAAYDYDAYIPSEGENLTTNKLYNDYLLIEANNTAQHNRTMGSISWVACPLLAVNSNLLESVATVKLRVSKEYKNFSNANFPTGGPNNGKPMYSWNMNDLSTEYGSNERLTDVLDIINIVPNPYYAHSDYERNRLDTRVKITNLPEKCSIKIYSSNGKLIRSFEKDSRLTYLDWDLNNNKLIPIASGVYLVHVDVPDVGETIIKFFGGMRQVDLQGI